MDKPVSFLHSFPSGEQAVSMVVHKDKLYIATNRRVYFLSDNGKLYSIPFAKQ